MNDARSVPPPDGGDVAPAELPPPQQNGLPKYAEKADDLESIKKAVDDAAAVGGGLWLSYLFVLFYLAVAAGAVTHRDLFFEHPVKLPFLGIELPLVAFFVLAPLIFLVVHAYTLVHLVMLTDKAKRYHQALYEQIGDKDGLSQSELNERRVTRDALRRQLPSNIFIQFLAGPSDLRESGFGWLLRAIAWITLVVGPILLLLMMQIQFLPYHSRFAVWTQRIALGLDLALVWWLWRKILSGRETDGMRRRLAWLWPSIGFVLSLAVLLVSAAVVTFPGEWQEGRVLSWAFLPALDEWGDPATEKDAFGQPKLAFWDWVVEARRVSPHDWLFAERTDGTTRRRFPFSSTLVLPSLNIYEGLGIDDPEKVKWHDIVFRARGRDLNGAIFDFASLPKVDFEGAQLEGASLFGAQLPGASLKYAQLQGASLFGAQLQGASLERAQLQGAALGAAQLQGASLERAQLQGASLFGAQLQGASLEDARLQGASLDLANLQAADLRNAFLWRATGNPAATLNALLPASPNAWRPLWDSPPGFNTKLWDDEAFAHLRKMIEALPPGDFRDAALERIRSLDCADKALASCNPASPTGPAAWANVGVMDQATYLSALAAELYKLACSGGEDAALVVRGLERNGRLWAVGSDATKLINDLTNKDNKDCPAAAALTDAERARLLRFKQQIPTAKESPPLGPAYSP